MGSRGTDCRDTSSPHRKDRSAWLAPALRIVPKARPASKLRCRERTLNWAQGGHNSPIRGHECCKCHIIKPERACRQFVSWSRKATRVLGCDLPPMLILRYLPAGKRIARMRKRGFEHRKVRRLAARDPNRMLKALCQPCHSDPSMGRVGQTYAFQGD